MNDVSSRDLSNPGGAAVSDRSIVRRATRAEPAQLAIIQALGSDPSPGGIQKMLV